MLLAASLWFYWCNRPAAASWGLGWQLLPMGLLVAVSLFCWALGRAIQAAGQPRRGRLVAVGVCCLLALLAVFKYFNFFVPVFAPGVLHKLPFPLGVSFYTFAAISYLVDVGRGDMPAEESPLNLTAFLCFFGTITAGPICRARTLLPQLRQEHRFDAARTVTALQLFALGLFRKVAVADPLYTYASQAFVDIPGHGGLSLLAATLAYTFYLYFDFAGYSEMARASALLLGLDIPENFKTPFFATNFSGFWNRTVIPASAANTRRSGKKDRIVFCVFDLWEKGAAAMPPRLSVLCLRVMPGGSLHTAIRAFFVSVSLDRIDAGRTASVWKNERGLSHSP